MEIASPLHPREEKFGCYHGSKACLGDLKSHVLLSSGRFYVNSP